VFEIGIVDLRAVYCVEAINCMLHRAIRIALVTPFYQSLLKHVLHAMAVTGRESGPSVKLGARLRELLAS